MSTRTPAADPNFNFDEKLWSEDNDFWSNEDYLFGTRPESSSSNRNSPLQELNYHNFRLDMEEANNTFRKELKFDSLGLNKSFELDKDISEISFEDCPLAICKQTSCLNFNEQLEDKVCGLFRGDFNNVWMTPRYHPFDAIVREKFDDADASPVLGLTDIILKDQSENKDIESPDYLQLGKKPRSAPLPKTKLVEKKCRLTSSNKALALRADVMNKNILRALRRECKHMFECFTKENGFTSSRSKRIFKANLRRFSAYLMESVEEQPTNSFDTNSFMIYSGVLINIWLMKRLFVEDDEKEKADEFNDLLYSYSHKRFNDFVSKPEVCTLIKVILMKQGLEGFIQSHPTLNANCESYTKHIQKMVDSI